MDEVWTNSEFQRAATGACSPVPVVNVSLAVWAGTHEISGKADLGVPSGKFVFLCVFDAGSTTVRENPLAAVRAFVNEFGEDDEVALVVKLHSAQHDPGLNAQLASLVRGLRNVIVLPGKLPEAEMAAPRAACDRLVSPHRSEGFGLNIAEFMALGKPAIATDYSGNLDYFDAKVGYPIAYQFVELKESVGPYLAGHVWAEPDLRPASRADARRGR